MHTAFFPPGIATGNAFCNRNHERALLKSCLNSHEHVTLISPRRYGKTSLLLQVAKESHLPYMVIDLLPIGNEELVKKSLLEGISKLIEDIIPKKKGLMQRLITRITLLQPKLTLSALGQKLEISSPETPAKSIMDALMTLNQIASELKVQAIVFLDEFQQINALSENHTIEASIRHAVERSTHITYIFSGSDRHVLEHMFNSKNRPLYRLCKIIRLERIHTNDFYTFLKKASIKKWGKTLSDEVINTILTITECHTYYVNYLCRELWKRESMPNTTEVIQAWKNYIKEQAAWIRDDIANLTANQRSVLTELTIEASKSLQSQYFSTKVGLAPASIKRVIDSLEKSNFIMKNDEGYYQVLDPAIAAYLRQII